MKGTEVLTLGTVGMSSQAHIDYTCVSSGCRIHVCAQAFSTGTVRSCLPLAHACYFSHTKWLTVVSHTEAVDAVSLQRSCFRRNPTNFLTFIAHWVRDNDFRTNGRYRGEMWLNRRTDTHTHADKHNFRNPRCACTLRVNEQLCF